MAYVAAVSERFRTATVPARLGIAARGATPQSECGIDILRPRNNRNRRNGIALDAQWRRGSASASTNRAIVVYVIRVKSLARRTAWLLTLCLNGPALRAQTPPGAHQSVEALEQRAQEYIQQQKPQLAIPVLRELVSVDPKNSSAQGNLGVLLFFDGKYAEAIPYMRSAVGSEPGLAKIEALLGIAEKRTGDAKAAQNHLEHAFESLDDKKIR